jgi:hypothetical protein
MKYFAGLLAALVWISANAAVSHVETLTYVVYRGTTIVAPNPTTLEACIAKRNDLMRQDGLNRTSGTQKFRCVATYAADATFSANPPPAPEPQTTLYINAGGPAISNYVADVHYVGGLASSNCQRTYSGIFLNRRYSDTQIEYRVPVKNGSYRVKLLTRECWNTAAGLRQQSATIEGAAVPTYDTYKADGGVIIQERTVAVSDGTLNIVVKAVKGDAILNGIDIEPSTAIPNPPGSVTLSWTTPTKNTDDTALTDLAGYRIHYGRSATTLHLTQQIDVPGATTWTLTGLDSGVWYFGVRSLTSGGAESALSNVASKSIP